MSDLVDFLLARIAEDEWLALSASHGDWIVASGEQRVEPVRWKADYERLHEYHTGHCEPIATFAKPRTLPWVMAAHAAEWDPARVLAECEAKRRLLAIADDRWTAEDREELLVNLAAPYAIHPDYREEWKP